MAKLTKQQYKRKRLFAGAVMFLSAVLVVTGISVWMLFGSLSESAGGNITVAEVAASPLKFTALKIDDRNVEKGRVAGADFCFDAPESDRSGHLQWQAPGAEKLSIEVTVTILGAQYLTGFAYSLELPQGVINAAAKGYLDISEFYDLETETVKTVDIPLSEGLMRSEGATSAWTLNRYKISLKWGEKFDGVNPSIYYDMVYDMPSWSDEIKEEVNGVLDDLSQTIMENNTGYTLNLIASANN